MLKKSPSFPDPGGYIPPHARDLPSEGGGKLVVAWGLGGSFAVGLTTLAYLAFSPSEPAPQNLDESTQDREKQAQTQAVGGDEAGASRKRLDETLGERGVAVPERNTDSGPSPDAAPRGSRRQGGESQRINDEVSKAFAELAAKAQEAPTEPRRPAFETVSPSQSYSPGALRVQVWAAMAGTHSEYLDGYYGHNLTTAVRAFQAEHGLTPDGVADAHTQRAMQRIAQQQAEKYPSKAERLALNAMRIHETESNAPHINKASFEAGDLFKSFSDRSLDDSRPVTTNDDSNGKFAWAVKIILSNEGYISNNPNDKGGYTKYGISQRAHPDINVSALTKAGAINIYKQRYWNQISGINQMTPAQALVVFDAAVNKGVDYSIGLYRQTGGNVPAMLNKRHAYYNAIVRNDASQGVFLRGWRNRLAKLKRIISGNHPQYRLAMR